MSFAVATAADIILLSACSFIGNVGKAVTGFGMAIVFLFVWNIADISGYDGDFKYAVFIQSLALIAIQPIALYNASVIKNSYRRILLLFIPITLVSTPLGQLLAEYVPTKTVQAVAGVLVGLVALWEMYSKRKWFASLCEKEKGEGRESVAPKAESKQVAKGGKGEENKPVADDFEDNPTPQAGGSDPKAAEGGESSAAADLESEHDSNGGKEDAENKSDGDGSEDDPTPQANESDPEGANVAGAPKARADESDPEAGRSSEPSPSQMTDAATAIDGTLGSSKSVRFRNTAVIIPESDDPEAPGPGDHSASKSGESGGTVEPGGGSPKSRGSDEAATNSDEASDKRAIPKNQGRSGLFGLGTGALSVYNLSATAPAEDEFKIGPNWATFVTLLAGGTSGFLGGMVAIRGPPLIFYFLHPPNPVNFNKNTQRATATLITFFNVGMRQIFYLYDTFSRPEQIGYKKEEWRLYLSVIVFSVAGTMVGNKIFTYLKDSKDTIRAILSVFLLLSASGLLFSAFRS